ncbi:hypothetical protein BDQ12DRAFT_594379 [Crucibulum laeve]|uniref:VanZ-like domain-containing protein n=1 Tax=Crucibulum laeve TaxID=68775 RepID=A0A5C3MI53_9AGAR|nr:hypothetical protein BDQ12DRAFT_594379 [Crucibulum laeve]
MLPQNARKLTQKAAKAVMKSHKFRIPKYDTPIRLRPWFFLFTCIIMLVLAFLGFTNFSRALLLNDKILHFICFAVATGVFYFIIDVEESARRIWFWRHSALIFTGFICFFCGGIMSEVVQSMLPYKEFQFGDIVANLLGSALGLFVAYYTERYYRHRREIARLYRPLNTDYVSDPEDDDDFNDTQLLPTHYNEAPAHKGSKNKGIHLADVWDEREELFGVGDESDDEDVSRPPPTGSKTSTAHL